MVRVQLYIQDLPHVPPHEGLSMDVDSNGRDTWRKN